MSVQQTMELKRRRSNVHNTWGSVVTIGATIITTTRHDASEITQVMADK